MNFFACLSLLYLFLCLASLFLLSPFAVSFYCLLLLSPFTVSFYCLLLLSPFRLLHVSPSRRLSAHSALSHPWFHDLPFEQMNRLGLSFHLAGKP